MCECICIFKVNQGLWQAMAELAFILGLYLMCECICICKINQGLWQAMAETTCTCRHPEQRCLGDIHCVLGATLLGDHLWNVHVQVAQLGEQQVQGCTARITHLETDLKKQVDYLKQQHDDQASSLAGVKAHLDQLSSTQHDSSSGQVAAQLSQLDARVSELQTAVTAATQKDASVELKYDIDVLKDQVQQMHDSHAGQLKAGSSLEELEREVASVKAAVGEEGASRVLAESITSGLQQDLVLLKEKLTQLSNSHSKEARDSQQPFLKLEQEMAELSATVLQVTKQAEGHRVQAETVEALQHDMSGLKAELAQLQSQHSAEQTHDELYSRIECDMAAAKDQLSSLRLQLTQHASQKPWQDELDKLRSELAACVKTASSTEAVVARHGTELCSLHSRLVQLHAEASTASQPGGQAQGASQSEVEDLNERLFELRVEVQNLDDNTGISIASMTRKVRIFRHGSCVCCCDWTLTMDHSSLQCLLLEHLSRDSDRQGVTSSAPSYWQNTCRCS